MPFIKRRYAKRKRPVYKKRRYNNRRRVTRPSITRMKSNSGPFPDRLVCKLNYTKLGSMTSSGSTPAYFQFNVNSTYDPETAIGGHQPMGFDQITPMYNNYRVYAVAYKLWITNQDTSSHAEVAVNFRNTGTVYTTNQQLFESPNMRRSVLGPEATHSSKFMRGYMSIAKIMGVSPFQVRNEEDFQALISSNPVRLAYMTIYAINQNTAANITINYRVILTYYCEFFGRKALSTS